MTQTLPSVIHTHHNRPYKNEAERARCGLFACHETDFMTRSQHYAVHFYSVLSVVIFCYILSQFACKWTLCVRVHVQHLNDLSIP